MASLNFWQISQNKCIATRWTEIDFIVHEIGFYFWFQQSKEEFDRGAFRGVFRDEYNSKPHLFNESYDLGWFVNSSIIYHDNRVLTQIPSFSTVNLNEAGEKKNDYLGSSILVIDKRAMPAFRVDWAD